MLALEKRNKNPLFIPDTISKNLTARKDLNQTPFHSEKKPLQIAEVIISDCSALIGCDSKFIASAQFNFLVGWPGKGRCDNDRESDGGLGVNLSR